MFARAAVATPRNALLRRLIAQSSLALGVWAMSPAAWPAVAGDPAPECAASTFDNARTIRVADYKGKVVYLDFWASWCPPCRESFPFMNELQRELGEKGLQIMAVSVDKVAADAQRFLARYPPQFTVALDTTWTCASAYLLPGMPTSFVIDKRGLIRDVHIGFRDKDKVEIRRQILELLDERS
ncbi:MAG TPA: TlpA disulfide reductase family protein [Casimicrobiaceae bacterium]